MPHCEHIVVWHLDDDDWAIIMNSLRHELSKQDKFVLLGRSYVFPWIKHLVDKENRKTEGFAATSKSSTVKSVPSSMQTEKSPAGLPSTRAVILGSSQACSFGTKSIATVSNIKHLRSAEIHEENLEPHGKGWDYADCVVDILTEWEGTLLLNVLVVCTLAGWAYGV